MSALSVQVSPITVDQNTFQYPSNLIGDILNITSIDFAEIAESDLQNDFLNDLYICYKELKIYNELITTTINSNRFNKNSNMSKIIKSGLSVLFHLRKILTGETLKFVVAGQTSKGELKERIYSQDEIFSDFSNFRFSFSQNQFELSSCIERLSSLTDSSLAGQWSDIIRYGFTKQGSEEEGIPIKTYEKNGQVYTAYRKSSVDINVYYKWRTDKKKRTLTYYYNINGSSIVDERSDLTSQLVAYDKGWLYQWLKIVFNDEFELGDMPTPLNPLFSADGTFRENIPGIKAGDNVLEQYKFRNRRVMTLTNMLNILQGGAGYTGLLKTFEKFFNSNSPEERKQQFINLLRDFTTWNEDQLQKYVNESFKELF